MDDVPLLQVLTQAELSAGEFFFDYTNDRSGSRTTRRVMCSRSARVLRPRSVHPTQRHVGGADHREVQHRRARVDGASRRGVACYRLRDRVELRLRVRMGDDDQTTHPRVLACP